ncbi:phosphate transport system permease protein [Granulicatella balaenopterae]|uniref:Phosphate transport system permease protein n=1 Tax=Granulicatella balaenopterae TaxID=137733 RepID=A0A1H9M227_9LACT|nr:phosphate ABC transporter permease subunit PstC [Granulicatella balaenopterae]SER17537.1 phosphate transport system permease protein [Granulicatella balaenopterae]
MKKEKLAEKVMEIIFFISAMMSVVAIATICLFIFKNGVPFMMRYGVHEFIFGTSWAPGNLPSTYGIFPMIMGSLVITLGALVIGVPLGILTAVFLVYFCSEKLYKVLSPSVNIMASIPSVIYGFFGLQLLVPLVRRLGGNGMSVLTASILLGIMIIPTIITLSEAALRSVPKVFYTGSIGLGATHERTILKVILPAAKSGIISAVILGVGRAIGETMAVILVAGNQPLLPRGLLKGVRTMTTNIVLEMAYATGEHREALIATSVVLFVMILVINFVFTIVKRRGRS